MSTPARYPPRQKPACLHDYVVAAANAQFPKQNGRRLARVLELLSSRRTSGDGWVPRSEIAALWPGNAPKGGLEERKRQSGTITNALADLKQQIERRLAWSLPHFTIKLEADPPRRAHRYRLSITRREAPWDFLRDEAPNTLPLAFSYRLGRGPVQTVAVRPWAVTAPGRTLEIEAVREPPQAEWQPHSHRAAYRRVREAFFEAEIDRHRRAGLVQLHPSALWGIKDVATMDGRHGMTVRVVTEKTCYPDLHFLKRNLDRPFAALRKYGSFRDWLQLESDPRSSFCPPRDALCVDALVVTRRPELTAFLSRQKAPAGQGRWEASAVGAASDAHHNVSDDRPDLRNQVTGVVHREIGLKVDPDLIRWLGFARGLTATSSASVLALVETNLTVAQVLEKFAHRRDRHDVEALLPVKLARMSEWLKTIPPGERGEFLELSLALAAIDYRLAVTA
ncbi:MAG TPA: hypothetical protein VG734_09895 [Lacunisphaera sp.]|nr:hypothetical protein [Lacunisphaera sp.]